MVKVRYYYKVKLNELNDSSLKSKNGKAGRLKDLITLIETLQKNNYNFKN